MNKIKLIRNQEDERQTLGEIVLAGLIKISTLELPWKDNEKFISRIPEGIYIVKKRWSIRFGHHFIITDVEGRTWILFHAGNFYINTKGCILVGLGLKDINQDGFMDVTDSKKALKSMLYYLPKRFELEIVDDFEEGK